MYPSPSKASVLIPEVEACWVPIPASPNNSTPSTNISSPTLNGWFVNPFSGVSKTHVTIPEAPPSIDPIPTPLELLSATTLWLTEFNPLIGPRISTLEIAWFGVKATNEESSTISFFCGSNRTKSGGDKYSLPPETILISLIVSTLSILIIGDTNASGDKVLSEEYSYPISIILTLPILPIEVDNATILALTPFSLITFSNLGTSL